jgi:ABC-type transport system involved in multi-copper enzyme maturation permease subunit
MFVLTRIWAIATNTVRQAVRSKLLYTLLFFALVLIGGGVLVSSLSYVEHTRIVQDIGLAAIRVFSIGIAIFVGVGLIHGEVDRRTIYTILSKPVSRSEFIVGKFVGLVLTIWLQLAIMTIAFVCVSLVVGAPIDAGHFAAIGLVAVELMLMIAVATLFSSFTTPMLASIFTIGIYFVGHLSRDLHELGKQGNMPGLESAMRLLFWSLPDLESFNLTVEAVHGLAIPASAIWLPVAYGLLYSSLLLVGAAVVFERRDLR